MWAVMAFGCNKMRPGEGCFPLEIFAVAYVPDASRRLVSFHYARTVFFLRSRRRDSLNREVMDFSFFLCYFFFFFERCFVIFLFFSLGGQVWKLNTECTDRINKLNEE